MQENVKSKVKELHKGSISSCYLTSIGIQHVIGDTGLVDVVRVNRAVM